MALTKISFETIWRLVKIIAVIQVFNAAMDYFMWIAYGYLVPSWTIATLCIFYTVLIVAIKKAQENEGKPAAEPSVKKKSLQLTN